MELFPYERRIPLYMALDCGCNMVGPPIEKAKACISAILQEARQKPPCLESMWFSLIAVGDSMEVVTPLQKLGRDATKVSVPLLDHRASTNKFGEVLVNRFSHELRKKSITEVGDWRPLVLWVSDGSHEELEKQPRRCWDKAKWPADFKALNCSEDDIVSVLGGFNLWISELLYPRDTSVSRQGDDESLFERLVRGEEEKGLLPLLPAPPFRITI